MIWQKHFTSVLGNNPSAVFDINAHINMPNYYPDMFDNVFTECEVVSVIARQPSGKAVGPDGVSYDVLKENLDSILVVLLGLFNACWVTRTTPFQWHSSYLKVKDPKQTPTATVE